MREALSKEKLRMVYDRIAGRYDLQHALITARSDQRGRKILVEKLVHAGNSVLDCGSGTGTTAIMAARKVGPNGRVTLFDLSENMLAVAHEKADRAGLLPRMSFLTGDMVHLPFADGCFDVVLSTYSLCPLYDPVAGVMEMYRVARPGGRIGVAHSASPANPVVKWLAERVDNIAWRFPGLSMGCRPVDPMPALQAAGARVIFSKNIGLPLWPFHVFAVEKPAG